MAKIITVKTYSRFGLVWVDPDSSKNRIFIDTYGYDYDSLAPKWLETFHWQDRACRWITSTDYNDYGLVQTGNLDGSAWAAANTGTYTSAGYLDTWFMSLDYVNYPVKRILKTARNNIVATYPRDAAGNGDWWMGRDLDKAATSYATGKEYQLMIYEQVEARNITITSWSYVTTTITVTATGHGLYVGDYVTISGATATTNPPNGTFPIQTVADANTFTVIVGLAPTGTAGGTVTVTGTSYRYWGLKPAATLGTNSNFRYRYDYTYDNNNATTYVSYPSVQVLGSDATAAASRYRFFMGQDGVYAWYMSVGRIGAHDYIVDKYDMRAGAGTATNVLASSNVTNPLTSTIQTLPSNIRHASSTRKVFYSSHYNTGNALAPMRLVWDTSAGTVTTTQCTLTYPSSTTFSTFAAVSASTNFDTTNGENAWWSKGHQFTKNGVDYITFTTIDKYAYANSGARVSSALQRTWLTFKIGSGTGDDALTLHSALRFNSYGSYPAAFVPFKSDNTEIAIMSDAGTSINFFDTTEFDASSWSYSTVGTLSTITVTAANHGLIAGYHITVSGPTATTNAPAGAYTILTVPDSNTFTFIASAAPTGSAGGTMHVASGWQAKFTNSVRARGYGVDSSGRLWLTTKTVATGYAEVHMIAPTLPSKISVVLDSSAGGTGTEYSYAGTPINTFVNVDAYDVYGNRMISSVTLIIEGTGMTFAGGSLTTTITTLPNATTPVAVIINGPGLISISTKVNP